MDRDYKIYNSELICKYQSQMIQDLNQVHRFFCQTFPNSDSTWAYKFYNVFCATSPSPLWYDLLQELKGYIRDFVGH